LPSCQLAPVGGLAGDYLAECEQLQRFLPGQRTWTRRVVIVHARCRRCKQVTRPKTVVARDGGGEGVLAFSFHLQRAKRIAPGWALPYGCRVITYEWRGRFGNATVNALHAEGFGHRVLQDDWWAQVNRHSLGWVCAWEGHDLVGFVNVAWDGAVHAFILDTLVTASVQRRGVGGRLVALAAEQARGAGCEWLHVDFEDGLAPFYLGACGFTRTNAGLIAL
jgi:GNAT superfamily N-acetyltransferase